MGAGPAVSRDVPEDETGFDRVLAFTIPGRNARGRVVLGLDRDDAAIGGIVLRQDAGEALCGVRGGPLQRHDHGHGLRLTEAGQVVEIAVVPVLEVAVAVARALRRGGHDGHAGALGVAGQVGGHRGAALRDHVARCRQVGVLLRRVGRQHRSDLHRLGRRHVLRNAEQRQRIAEQGAARVDPQAYLSRGWWERMIDALASAVLRFGVFLTGKRY